MHKMKYQWFISYLLILCIPIGLCVALWVNMQVLINKERAFEGKLQTKNLVLQLETKAENNETIVKYFEKEPVFNVAYEMGELKSEGNIQKIQQLSDLIAEYMERFGKGDTLFIYLRRVDLIVTADGYWKPFDYWKQHYINSDVSYSDWKLAITRNYDIQYMLYSVLFHSESETDVRNFLYTMPVQLQDGGGLGAMIALQSAEEIRYWDEQRSTYFIIYDKDGKLIYDSGNLGKNMVPVLVGSQEEKTLKYNGKQYAINREISEKLGYQYIAAVELHKILSPAFVGMLVALMIICILLCIWLSWKVSAKNYVVFEQIIDRLQKFQKQTVLADEKSMIDSMIDNLLQENRNREKRLFKQKNQITTFNVSMLCNGHIQAFEAAQGELIENERMTFLSDCFVVVIIMLEDYIEFLEEDNTEAAANEAELVRFAVKNIATEIISRQGDVTYSMGMEENVTILVSVSPENIQDVPEKLTENCRYIQNFLKEQLKIITTISISSPESGISRIQIAYQQAQEIAKYKDALGKEVITPEDVNILNHAGYRYTHEREEWLISLLKSADKVGAEALVQDILTVKDKQKLQDIKRLQHMAYCIVGTLVRFCEENGMGDLVDDEFLDIFMNAEDLETMKQIIVELVEQICTQDEKKPKSLEIAQSVMQYIDNNYTDSNLTVAVIADQYRLHPTYLSNTFKKEMNIGMLEYINKQRINLASELLLKTNCSVNTISDKVGYLNVNSFIRVFKKIMGTTPSKYRSVKKILNIREGK